MDWAKELVGKPLEEAEAIAIREGFDVRVVNVDGEDRIVTTDYRLNRLNVAISGNIVSAYMDIG